jgi:hypothetical protein
MVWYRWLWTATYCLLTLVGVRFAFTMGPATALAAFCAFAVMGAVLAAAASCLQGRSAGGVTWSATVGALTFGTFAAALTGFALAFDVGAWLLALCVIIGCPWCLRSYYAWLESAGTRSGPQLHAGTSVAPDPIPALLAVDIVRNLRTLTDEQLRATWLATSRRVHGPGPVDEQAQAVQLRQTLLDEIERRNPECFHAWLTSSENEGDVIPIKGEGSSRRAVDWDALLAQEE